MSLCAESAGKDIEVIAEMFIPVLNDDFSSLAMIPSEAAASLSIEGGQGAELNESKIGKNLKVQLNRGQRKVSKRGHMRADCEIIG